VVGTGGILSQAVAARLRHVGFIAQKLEGGHEAWREGRHPLLVRAARIPQRDNEGHTIWVTRARPKVVRASPWLIRRFINPSAVFLFVPSEVRGVAELTKVTGELDLTPQSADLLASCLGFSRVYRDDLAQLAAAMAQFDAHYRWSRDASDERHG
jgi:hypothetical protein